MRTPKKDKVVRARLPYTEHRDWLAFCRKFRLTSSQGLRQAMRAYTSQKKMTDAEGKASNDGAA